MIVDQKLTAKIEPFDSFWEAPENVEKGYVTFGTFYRRNYLKYLPLEKNINILIISCGPGYFLKLLRDEGYRNTLGIDSDPKKIEYAKKNNLNCKLANAFNFLKNNSEHYDVIIAEQELNHLTKEEILIFLELCCNNLNTNGTLIVHSLNGANPITGSEAIAQNFNHYNSFTEYSLRQVLEYANFSDTKVIPLNLYVFYENPLNYAGIIFDILLTLLFRLAFIFYGKSNKIFTKKIGAISQKKT